MSKLKDYKVHLGKSVDLEAVFNDLGPSDDYEKELEKATRVTCPECDHKFEL